jgi:HD-GYP domain-containing protein (c-di-GMP phosphodiesterase class II)
LSEAAASHHEKLDGSGYFRALSAEQLPLASRILAVADIYDALSAQRPYRDALPRETVFAIMRKEVPHALDASVFDALTCSAGQGDRMTADLASLSQSLEPEQYANSPAVPAFAPISAA